MLICGHLDTFPNTFWGDGIWYFKYQIPNTFCIFNFNIIIMTKHNKWTSVIYQVISYCHFLSANFRLNVHYQSIISRKYPIQNPCYGQSPMLQKFEEVFKYPKFSKYLNSI